MTDKELQDFIKHGETGFVEFAMVFGDGWARHAIEIAKALRARISQCERCGEVNPAEIHTCSPQEPVAWMYEYGTDHGDAVNQIFWHKNLRLEKPTGLVRNVVPLYTTPPQREWQGLTDEDRQEIERWIEFKEAGGNDPVPAQKIITYVEAKLKEKNT